MNNTPCLFLVGAVLLVLFPKLVGAQAKALGEIVKELQSIRFKEDEFPFSDVPVLVQQLLLKLKQGLRQEIMDALEDEQKPSATPEALREVILRKLQANNLQIWSPDPNQKEDDYSALYGNLLSFDVSSPQGHPDLLAFRATVSLPCGDDSSLYIFQREKSRWRFLVGREQDNFTTISDARGRFDFRISPSDENGEWFVVAVDVSPWCTSNWQSIRYEVLRASFTADRPRVLFSEQREIYLGVDDTYDLAVRKDGFELKHAGSQSLDSGLLTRDHVENYSVREDRVVRVPPFALKPEDFLDEWIGMSWDDAKVWSESARAKDLKLWHSKLHRPNSYGFGTEFDFVQPCPGNPPVLKWQIGLSLDAFDKSGWPADVPKELFFTISKRGKEFFLQDVAAIRPGGCPGKNAPRDSSGKWNRACP